MYCDGCPRAFHLWCLDPPMDAMALPELGERWYCHSCTIRKVCLSIVQILYDDSSMPQQHPPPKLPSSAMSSLIYQVQTSVPKEFQLPHDIRNYFKDGASPGA